MSLQTFSGYYKGMTLTQLEEAILWELGQVIGTTVSYDRFPQARIRQKLNDRQNWFVFFSHCIKKFALILAKEDYRQYKLPENCIDGGLISVKWYDTSSSYDVLEVVDIEFMDEFEEDFLVQDSSDPEYAFIGSQYGNIPVMEVHPAPDADGTDYSVSPDTGVSIGGDLPGSTSNISGTATGGGANTLQDTGVSFVTLGVVAGVYVRNVTDGSYAYVQTVAANTLTFAANLTGGTANTFSAGDSYLILIGEYGVLVDWENDDRFIFGSEIGILSTVTVPAGNFRIDFVPYPLEFPSSGNGDMLPDIPRLYHEALVYGVVSDFLRTFHEKTREFGRAEFYDAKYMQAATYARDRKTNRPARKLHRRTIRPRFRR